MTITKKICTMHSDKLNIQLAYQGNALEAALVREICQNT